MFAGFHLIDRFPHLGSARAHSKATGDASASHPRFQMRRRRVLIAVAGLALLLLTLVPALSVGATSPYPPNTVISTYYDGRYGEVSVVTDGGGNLIDINAVTGQRIYPIYPDYPTYATYPGAVAYAPVVSPTGYVYQVG